MATTEPEPTPAELKRALDALAERLSRLEIARDAPPAHGDVTAPSTLAAAARALVTAVEILEMLERRGWRYVGNAKG